MGCTLLNKTGEVFIMKTRKMDRRVARTRQSLRDALFELILEKGYAAVMVEDITDRANLGRTTFYLHYRNKEDLLLESVREQLDELIDRLSQLKVEGSQGEAPASDLLLSATTQVFQDVQKSACFYTIVLRGEGTHQVIGGMRRIIVQAISELIQRLTDGQHADLDLLVPQEIFLASLSGSWIGLLTWWLENEMPYTPEEMAQMYHRMFLHSTGEILGVSQPQVS